MKIIDKILVVVVGLFLVSNIALSFMFAKETSKLIGPAQHLNNSIDSLANTR